MIKTYPMTNLFAKCFVENPYAPYYMHTASMQVYNEIEWIRENYHNLDDWDESEVQFYKDVDLGIFIKVIPDLKNKCWIES